MAETPFPLPDAEALFAELQAAITPHLGEFDALVGIHAGGSWIAERLRNRVAPHLPLGVIDVSFYRDDLAQRGLGRREVRPTELPFAVEGARILLVDDVLYTGRTVRAAINELFDYGRPAAVRLAALADRGGRELPICADFCPWRTPEPLPEAARLELLLTPQQTFRWELHR
jgi:pyrimidine operon attenuation protein/uracil phosphoribosyltransferase